jgi:two-component system, NtrC family, sensor kinase
LMVKPACMTCHEKQGYRLGDVRGGISVSLKLDSVENTLQKDIQASIISHGISYSLLVLISWGLIELLARRWRSLDDTIETLQVTRNELVETEKMASLGRLVAGFAHEINTPVGVAVGAVSHGDEAIFKLRELFKQEEVSEEALFQQIDDLSESHQLALGNLRRAAELVQRFKRTSIDQSSHQERDYQLEEVIQDVLTTLRNTLKQTNIEIAVSCPPELTLYGTPGLLGQVLTNLIMNSINHGFDHGNSAGHITISVHQTEGQMLCIDYMDDGSGMTDQVRSKAFEPFFTTNREQGGTGLGLYVIYNIITQQMAGKIHIQSAPGAGVHFQIEFPMDTRLSESTL